MTKAVCMSCGEYKFGALTKCEHCNQTPKTIAEIAFSVGLTDSYFEDDVLEEMQDKMKRGIEFEFEDSFIDTLITQAEYIHEKLEQDKRIQASPSSS